MTLNDANCEYYRELIDLTFDGELDDERRKVLERHLAACADCARETELLRVTAILLEALPQAEVPPGFDEAVIASVRRARAAGPAASVGRWMRPAAAFGAVGTAVYVATGTAVLRSWLWSVISSVPKLVADVIAGGAPLARLVGHFAGAGWTVFAAAVNLADLLGERLVLEQSIILVTTAGVLAVYLVVRRFARLSLQFGTR